MGASRGGLAIRQVRVSDQVADYIVRLIAEDALEAGDVLPSESELARRFEVSRPTVREATHALAGRGLISVSSGRSPVVSPLAQGPFADLMNHGLAIGQLDMLHVIDVRRGLEEVAAELAALHRTEEQAARIGALADRLQAAHGDADAFWRIDLLFHQAIAAASHNRLLLALLAGISDVVSRSSQAGLMLASGTEDWDLIVQVHQDTASGVIDRDPGRARAGMAAHFASAIDRFGRATPQQNRG
jgi:DNA-binding FadR family transcriptional regulator